MSKTSICTVRGEEWRGTVFLHRHRVMRGDELICEGRETRAPCVKQQDCALKAVARPIVGSRTLRKPTSRTQSGR
jgi:hypothetical protein